MYLLTVVLVATALLSLVSQSPRWLAGGIGALLCLFYPFYSALLLLSGAAVCLFIHFHKRNSHHANPKL
ncbi:MAG: hypothetical protein Q7K57_47715, partial [Burkholderiaceae bacterium]|nr:hypothetical protein [Burkholderiaceae bacterium]